MYIFIHFIGLKAKAQKREGEKKLLGDEKEEEIKTAKPENLNYFYSHFYGTDCQAEVSEVFSPWDVSSLVTSLTCV